MWQGVSRAARASVLARCLGGMRVAIGAVAMVAPSTACRPWIGPEASLPAVKVLGRAMGGRDLALGLGALVASSRGAPTAGWIRAGGLADAADLVATVAGFGRLPRRRRWIMAVVTAGAAATAVALSGLLDGDPPAAAGHGLA